MGIKALINREFTKNFPSPFNGEGFGEKRKTTYTPYTKQRKIIP
jgi:hypothetical protein